MGMEYSQPDGDVHVIHHVCQALQQGNRVWFGTVLATYGSSPRPSGSLWAWADELGMAGSLSGGCVEEDLLARLRSGVIRPVSQRLRFGAVEEERQRYRLPCGGVLDVLLEPLGAEDLTHMQHMLGLLQRRQSFVRTVSGAGYQLTDVHSDDHILCHEPPSDSETDPIGTVRRIFKPQWQLLLIGAGDVARQLAQLALPAGFAVTLCDHRDDFLQGFNVPNVDIAYTMPDQLVKQQFSDKHSAIVALAHDPRLDDMALLDAFETQAYYIGAMGSQRTSALRRERLQELGISSAQLQRLHAPIGLDIGSKTPYDIAISILAHLLQQRPKAATDGLS